MFGASRWSSLSADKRAVSVREAVPVLWEWGNRLLHEAVDATPCGRRQYYRAVLLRRRLLPAPEPDASSCIERHSSQHSDTSGLTGLLKAGDVFRMLKIGRKNKELCCIIR